LSRCTLFFFFFPLQKWKTLSPPSSNEFRRPAFSFPSDGFPSPLLFLSFRGEKEETPVPPHEMRYSLLRLHLPFFQEKEKGLPPPPGQESASPPPLFPYIFLWKYPLPACEKRSISFVLSQKVLLLRGRNSLLSLTFPRLLKVEFSFLP